MPKYETLPIRLIEPQMPLPRSIQENMVKTIAESMGKIGLMYPISVKRDKIIRTDTEVDGWRIIAGHHRRKAAIELGWKEINCFVYEDDEINAKGWTISENLHRADLTTEEAQRFNAAWAIEIMGREVQEEKLAGCRPVSNKGGRGKKGGVRAASREMGVPRSTLQDAIKATANLDPEAAVKEAAYKEKERQRAADNRAKKKAEQTEHQETTAQAGATIIAFTPNPPAERETTSVEHRLAAWIIAKASPTELPTIKQWLESIAPGVLAALKSMAA